MKVSTLPPGIEYPYHRLYKLVLCYSVRMGELESREPVQRIKIEHRNPDVML